MLGILKRFMNPGFDIPAIGDHWLVRPLTHDGVPGTLRVRQLPSDMRRKRFPMVAMSWVFASDASEDASTLSSSIQAALERQRRCLLVLVHETAERTTWYAYAADSKDLDEAFASLGNPSLRWGINDDADWIEYENARGLVGA